MFSALMAAANARIAETRQSLTRLVIGVVLAVAALILLLSALLSALFLVVTFHYGPIAGHLSVAGAALLVAIVALLYAFRKPRPTPAATVQGLTAAAASDAQSLRTAAVSAATGAGVQVAGAAAGQAFEAARAAGERIRSIGASIAEEVTGERKQPVARKTMINATLAAVIVGVLLGRRM